MFKTLASALCAIFLLSLPAIGDQVSKGKLTASNGKSFPYTLTDAEAGGVTVVYIGGIGGRGNEVSKIAKSFTSRGLNLVTFDRAEASCSSTKACAAKVASRVPSKKLIASPDGRPTAADDIMKNEIAAIMKFVTSSKSYNEKKGIVLIGGSYGSWLTLVATQSKYKSHIKGAVFLSPAINPAWVSGSKAPKEGVSKYKTLVRSFSNRKSIAVGSKKDKVFPNVSTLDTSTFLSQSLRAKPQVVAVKSSKHSSKLILGDKGTREVIIGWIAKNF